MLHHIITEFCSVVKENPTLVLKTFISKILDKPISEFSLASVQLSNLQCAYLQEYIKQFLDHKPISKILNESIFYGYSFYVNENVLDPRNDSEILIDSVLNEVHKNPSQQSFKILDVCTGSGVLLLTLLQLLPNAHGTGTDICPNALAVANRNRAMHNMEERCLFVERNALKQEGWDFSDKFDIIISNPPYIQSHQIKTLPPSVVLYDPLISLDGGVDGMRFYKAILENAARLMHNHSILVMELGYDTLQPLCYYITNYTNMYILSIDKDLSGINRVANLKLNSANNIL